ncbi:hypothetical protein [Polaromonas sp.]|uniref:hypothetical protein n=1 Tax=Polaromonas sp. TaxID=1869339 RepID=UPI00352ABBEA
MSDVQTPDISCPAFPPAVVACLILARDHKGAFIKAIVTGRAQPVCRRSDLGITRFVEHLKAQGMHVPPQAQVRRPIAGHADTIANCIAAEADIADNEAMGQQPS